MDCMMQPIRTWNNCMQHDNKSIQLPNAWPQEEASSRGPGVLPVYGGHALSQHCLLLSRWAATIAAQMPQRLATEVGHGSLVRPTAVVSSSQ